MINSGLIKLKNSDKKIVWYFFAEIIFISSLIASTYSNPYLFLISILAITLLIYFESTSIYTSLFLSVFCALVPFMALSAILGLNFFQSYEGFISSSGSKILIFILFCISFYFHGKFRGIFLGISLVNPVVNPGKIMGKSRGKSRENHKKLNEKQQTLTRKNKV